ncbi:hypothetical protein ASE25_15365 [Terrabacter sp. Root85]|uniref:hypothetical protein n=1 Tax=Terrabacter sp. Root85 TaxID=1736603 RepID=UPI0006FE862E|nr:hypothetical protein [Terrabacter sp. Root85]KRC88222.1 hypothetical protein ASE25_15365 [Terrabacter sp. Root85]
MAQASVGLAVTPAAQRGSSWRPALLWVQDHVTGRDRELARLDWQIESVRARLAGQPLRASEAWEGRDDARDRPDPQDEVLLLLDKAAVAREQHDAGKGWALVSRAEELEVSFLGRHQLEAARHSLRCEIALDEEAGWWREAALDLLRRMSAGPTGPTGTAGSTGSTGTAATGANDPGEEPPARRSTPSDLRADREYLREARRIRNDLNSSRYTAMEANTAQRIWLSVILLGLLAVAGWLIWAHLSTRSPALDTPWLASSAAVAGTIGAVTSAMQRLCARPRAQPPSHLGSLTTAVVHALIGSVAALTFYFAAAGGLITFPGAHADLLIVLGAFGSGFAERLVVYVPRNKS